MVCVLRQVDDADLDHLCKRPEELLAFLERGEGEVDLDKAWHGIHFLLTRSAWEGPEPLCYLLQGGEDVGDVDVGYGPARALRARDVADFSAAVAKISSEEFRSRFDPDALKAAEIYPDIWDRDPAKDDALGYLTEYFELLQSVLADCAAEGKGLLIYYS
jgi:hypothetical protein